MFCNSSILSLFSKLWLAIGMILLWELIWRHKWTNYLLYLFKWPYYNSFRTLSTNWL